MGQSVSPIAGDWQPHKRPKRAAKRPASGYRRSVSGTFLLTIRNDGRVAVLEARPSGLGDRLELPVKSGQEQQIVPGGKVLGRLILDDPGAAVEAAQSAPTGSDPAGRGYPGWCLQVGRPARTALIVDVAGSRPGRHHRPHARPRLLRPCTQRPPGEQRCTRPRFPDCVLVALLESAGNPARKMSRSSWAIRPPRRAPRPGRPDLAISGTPRGRPHRPRRPVPARRLPGSRRPVPVPGAARRRRRIRLGRALAQPRPRALSRLLLRHPRRRGAHARRVLPVRHRT